jgi:aminoglycoside phosphotransferase
MDRFKPLPSPIYDISINYTYELNTIGCSGSTVYKILDFTGNSNAFLKICQKSKYDKLIREKDILTWLNGKLPVPKVLSFCENQQYEFILLSEIVGLPSFAEELRSNSNNVMEKLGESLKLFHSIDISNCPFSETINDKLTRVKDNIQNNRVDTNKFETENYGKNVNDLFSELMAYLPTTEDLVFTHGDFCMPNILFHNNTYNGFIDLGMAGISDRYHDISLAMRSIKYNGFSENQCNIFLESYGILNLDIKKLRFFRLLDEFC